MPMFEFWLGVEDTDRLFSVKATQGKNNLTGNEFCTRTVGKRIT